MDTRGRFSETFRASLYPNFIPVQDNYSFSNKGVLRGLHYVTDQGQNQVLTVVSGTLIDFIVDLRPRSETFLDYIETKMSFKNINQLYIPNYCAHGFLATSDSVVLNYKTDTYYERATDSTIQIIDPKLDIKLPVDLIFERSDKDASAKNANEHTFSFSGSVYGK